MLKGFLRLWLAATLILAASAVLLLTDRERPRVGAGSSGTGPETSRPSRTWKVGLAAYSESNILDEDLEGFRRGLEEAGLVQGRDFTTTYCNAQGDIATLSSLLDEFNGDDSDLVVSISTTALQAALRKVVGKPIVFTGVLSTWPRSGCSSSPSAGCSSPSCGRVSGPR